MEEIEEAPRVRKYPSTFTPCRFILLSVSQNVTCHHFSSICTLHFERRNIYNPHLVPIHLVIIPTCRSEGK